MKHARVLLVLVSLGLGACGASGSAGQVTGAAGTTGSAGTGITGAAGSGAACQVDIQPIVPSSFAGLVPGPSALMRVRGNVTGMVPTYEAWKWSVSLADGSLVPVTTVGRDPSLVEFTMATPGSYTISVQLTSSMFCMGLRTITAAKPGAHVATYRLHVTPPSTDFAPEQDVEKQVVGGTPSGGNALPLSGGMVVPLDLRRAGGGQPLPAYVRFTEATSRTVVEARTAADGSASVRVAPGRYEMLIVPDGDVAPALLPAQNVSALGGTPISMDDGALVSGSVTNTDGTPIAGATVVLRAGDLTSTAGKTDAAGAFKVRARVGTFGVTVVSGLTAGGLESKLAAAAGVVVAEASPTPPLTIKLHPDPLVTGVVSLSAKDAASVTPETRVTLTAMEPLAGFATIAVGTAAAQAMASDVHLTLHPGANGAVSTGGIPRGRYKMTIFPASAGATDGVTTATLDLTAGNVGPLAMPLAQKVRLKGRLGPQATTQGVRLVALDDGGLPVVAEGDAGAGGVFDFAVSPMRRYALRALPRPYQAFARASFPSVSVADIDLVVQDRTMPRALLYGGRVVDPSLQGVGTALVQAYCIANTAGCADPATPVAETVTRTDGTFELMLPDPDGAP